MNSLFPTSIDWHAPRSLVTVAVLVVLMLLPVLLSVGSNDTSDFYVKFVTRVLIYALAAIGLNLILGFGGLVSLGHAMYVMLGAYAVAIPCEHGINSGWIHLGIAVGLALLLALAIGAVSLRTSGIGFIMITLAFAQMLYFAAVSLKQYGGDDGLTVTTRSQFGFFSIDGHLGLYYAALLCVAAALYLCWRIVLSPFGLVLRASKANSRRAVALGHPVVRFQLAAYALSAVICAIAGVLLANLTQFASPAYGAWTLSGELIVIVILGGLGTVFGPLVGAVLLLTLEEVLPSLVEFIAPAYKANWMLLLGCFIFAIALSLRRGVYGSLSGGHTGRAARTTRE